MPTSESRALRAKILKIHHRLLEAYGEPPRPRLDPVSELVSTILSQNTNDTLSGRAYDRLRERYPTWEEVRDAPVREIVKAIQVAGLAQQKGPRIKKALRHITRERGELDLSFLGQLPIGEARQWLMSIEGVGPKTAAIVLLFSLNRPAFPVDTHVHRVTRRLGLVPPKASADKAHQILEDLVPPELYLPFHLNIILHGRQVCHARRPACEVCVLRRLCRYYAEVIKPQTRVPSVP
ncbi:MAG: endonuclease III domain-containing protein [Anaerolineae bacterium]